MKSKLKVNSVFESISGEAGFFPQGTWCAFIRLQGCNFFPKPCDYCDTPHAQDPKKGRWMTIHEISGRIYQRHVLITGGEPLLQKEALTSLITYLLKHTDCQIQIETNGSIYPLLVEQNPRIGWVLDYKLGSSGTNTKMMSLDMFVDILEYSSNNYLKFVVANREDLSEAIDACKELIRCGVHYKNFIISPIDAKGMIIPYIVQGIEKTYPALLEHAIFSVQLHKLIDLP